MGSMTAGNDRMNVWASFLHAHAALMDVLEAELQDRRDLPLSWYDVLITLAQSPHGEMRMHDLARRVLISKSGLTRLFDRMEHAGLVERKSCTQDRRGTFAVMTPSGRRTLRRAMPVHGRGVEQHFLAHLTPGEAAAMQSAFDKILRALDRDAVPCEEIECPAEAAAAVR
jgi:DNA-binding MarR family transcriptional regulator